MRVVIDLASREDGHVLRTWVSGDLRHERAVRWVESGVARLLVSRDADEAGDNDAADLASRIDQGSATAQDLAAYGQLLFDAAFGEANWRELVELSAAEPYLELAIRGGARREDGADGAIQALHWEAIHDGDAFVATMGTQTQPGHRLSVGIVRLVPATDGLPEAVAFSAIDRIPRVLFAVGSRLTDPRVRPGAEFMGILRHLEREGGSIQPRVLESASLLSLGHELTRFKPDVLHLIGHGRWDPAARCVKLQLQAEGMAARADEYVTAEQVLGVLGESGHTPTVVVLSACQTAALPGGPGGDAAGTAGSINALPFAARLVAGGVPIAVAMAGDLADTACRVFTRALTHAIDQGMQLVRAVIVGRRAAFYNRDRPDLTESTDWMLPVLFLSERIPSETRLVDIDATAMIKERARILDLVREPVFCGRAEFITAFDRLIDASDPLNVLIAHAGDQGSYGGMRLLRELGARAVRSGRVPVLLGPCDEEPPTNRQELAGQFRDKLEEIRVNLGLADREVRAVAVAADPQTKPRHLARAIRSDLDELERDLPESDLVRNSPHPRVVLLCHQVHRWLDALDDLLAMLGPQGLGPGEHPLPVVMTGADSDERGSQLREARLEKYNGATWITFEPLGRFRSDDDDPEDILAYQWWLLNPMGRHPVFAPRRGSTNDWQRILRQHLGDKRKPLYDEPSLFGMAAALEPLFFTSDTDNDVLKAFSDVAP